MTSSDNTPATSILSPPYDTQITAVEDSQHRPIPSSLDELLGLRKEEPSRDDEVYTDPRIAIDEISVPGAEGSLHAVVLTRKPGLARSKPCPGVLFFHGGGRVMGNVYVGLAAVNELVKELDAVIVSVGYRLSPEVSGADTIEDCYSSLVWMSENLGIFNIDPARFMIAGVSAGAGLAAGTVLLSRDRKGPRVCAQLLSCPMLDDRCLTLSSKQFENGRGYYTAWGRYSWKCVLGEDAEKENVSQYVAPGRAQDLSNLPPAYIDAGSAEPFRDEGIAYATKLWKWGVQADLHIWGGGCHGFDLFFSTEIGSQAIQTRDAWLRRTMRENSG